MKKLIVNADDFGRHELINKAVEQATEKGILRSATLMPGAKAFDSAVDIGRRHPELGVGIHFTLVNGFPVLPPKEIPSLVTEEGVFVDDHSAFVKKLVSGSVNMQEVRAELGAQLRKMQNTGLSLTHADSHQHMHTLPGVINVVLDLVKEAGIKAVRIPKAPLFSGEFGGIGQLIGRLGLGTLAMMAGSKAKARGVATPDYFAGIVAGEAVTEENLAGVIRDLKPGVTEVMMHPGTHNGQLIPETGWDHDFEAEFKAMTSPAIIKLIEENKVKITNFRSLVMEG
ncbi:Cellobiose phosphotransferase system YdjC-like protein [Anaerovibrio sp. JC8]|uniref:ChbG/HpnK family deacetylase n=1 Tax=Anaerovibrio sp. JC8 TaxID=1240085 RepID=UPI000A0A31FE|nr:ChbG/HpnK family deacetylase [Anaerovibrio sp. JC8]ORU00188.1 Cellobiose phosphotransferase system YdjC-like protein [Anaerovibrio sp. JC8]